jgi:hypothetical protein
MRLSRRPILFILLALLTLAVQQGALRHELNHGLGSPATELRDQGGVPPAAVCEACLAYAAVGAALPAVAHIPPLACELFLPPGMPAAGAVATAPRAYRARAPPPSV